MKIPIIQAEEKIPSTTYPVEQTGLRQLAAAGGHVQGLIDSIVTEQGKILEKQRAMDQATEIAQSEIDVQSENRKLIEDLEKNPDPNNYYKNWETGYLKITKDRLSKISDPDTRKMAELTFMKMLPRNMINQGDYGRRLWLDNQLGVRTRIIDAYIKGGEPDKAIQLVENGINGGIYKQEEGAKLIIGIKDKAEKKNKEDNYAKALNTVMIDPSEDALNKAIKQYDIPIERQAELRRQQRIERDAKERQNKEIEDLAREKEDREISDLYLSKKYSQVYDRAQKSTLLTAQRKTFWGDHSEAAAKRKEEVEPGEEASEIAYINQIIRKEVSPQVIKDYIITTPRLNESTKKQQIEKIEKYVDKEINRAASRSYEYLKKEIVSPIGIAGILAKSIPENVRGANYAKAQLALDDWIDKQRMADKPISGTDIFKKAEEIVTEFRPKINQRSPIIQKNMKDMIQGLGELGKMSEGKTTEVTPPKEGKVKQTKYKSIDEVRNAYNRKELTYAEADEILKRDFGAK